MSLFSKKNDTIDGVRYGGYNVRLFANLLDSLIFTLAMVPFLVFAPKADRISPPPAPVIEALQENQAGMISDDELYRRMAPYVKEELPRLITTTCLSFILFGLVFLVFWKVKHSTPGKMLLKLRIVDYKTNEDPSTGQYLLRFLGYILAAIPLGLGFLMIAFSKKKRGLHDLISGTAVIYTEPFDAEKEKKKFKYQTYLVLTTTIIIAIYFAMQ